MRPKSIRLASLAVAAFMALPALAQDVSVAQAHPETRTVTDFLGNRVDIPVAPQRVVYLGSSPADLIQLGLPPVGASLSTIASQVAYPELLDGIEDVGNLNNFDFETITVLAPDLIILDGVVYGDSHATLTRIAPTVAYDSRVRMYDRLRRMADLIGRSRAAETWIESYESRAAATINQLAIGNGETATAMIALGGNIYVMGKRGLAVTLYDILDLSPPPEVQTLIDANERFASVSDELLPDYVGQWLFVLTETDQDRQHIENNSVFSAIPAVQEGRVFYLDGMWNFDDPVTRERLLDELTRHLPIQQSLASQ